jgi:hypothetical protein
MKMGQLLSRSILIAAISILFSSCDFQVVKNPGPQISRSVKQAIENNTFICSYKLCDSSINGVRIESVFVEKKYFSDGSFFSKFDVDCCKSQLVIVSVNYLASEGTGFSVNWDIPYFNLYSSNIIYRDYEGLLFPDSIPLKVVSIKGKNKNVIQELTLYKEDLN